MRPDPEPALPTVPEAADDVVAGAAGHYCRPRCAHAARGKEARKSYKSAAAAEVDGLLPCPHCRPALALQAPASDAAGRLARRALTLLTTAAARADAAGLAAALHVDEMTLSAAFHARYGVTPAQYADMHALRLAQKLLVDTGLPDAVVAQATGFADGQALRIALARHHAPDLPARPRAAPTHVEFELAYQPPYAWRRLLGFLGGRTIDGAESIDGDCYRRTLRVPRDDVEHQGWIEVADAPAAGALRVGVALTLVPVLPQVLSRVRHVFDLAIDPLAVSAALGELAADEPGQRLPGAFDAFELAVRAVLGQQITVKAARTLAARFTAAFGTPIATPFGALNLLFPSPATVSAQSVDAIASLGIIGARARSILGLAEAMASGRLVLEPGAPLAPSVQALKALPGIGEWTAQYISMRALGARDAFPHTDYGVMKSLAERNPRRVLELAEAWRPWRAYAVMHLWRRLA
jgi:AraC family transcriptional regulator of adaptative response / DNA-3-methyladenine glycosylase II